MPRERNLMSISPSDTPAMTLHCLDPSLNVRRPKWFAIAVSWKGDRAE